MANTFTGLSKRREPASSPYALVGVLILVYIVSQFFRNSIGVIGPDLAREFQLEASHLSLLASAFFLSFALVQIPLGMAIDRYGPKICLLAPSAILLAGTLLFAFARNFSDLVLARLIIGLGCSSFLMAPLTIYAERFPPAMFATMVGLQVGAGNLGSLGATKPLAFVAGWVGWRNGFLMVAAVVAIATVLVMVLVRDDESAKQRRKDRAETIASLMKGVVAAARTRSFWPIFFMQLVTYPAFAAILGLWSGPWLAQVYGLDLAARGSLLFALALAQIGSLFAWGMADRLFGSYKIPCLLGAFLCAIVLAVGAIFPIPRSLLLPYLIVLGLVFGFSPVMTSHGKSLFPPELTGRGLSLMNIAAMGGVFLQQILTGAVIETFDSKIVDGVHIYPAEAYRWVFGLLAAEIAIAIVFYFRTIDRHPSRMATDQT
ncbi:MAG: MFS transporter [Beijerinckiaceae bacterium]